MRKRLFETLRLNAATQFEKEFGQQILQSEKARVKIMAALFAVLSLNVIVVFLVFHDQLDSMSTNVARFRILGLLAGAFVYELGVLFGINRALKYDISRFGLARYMNAFVETSIPTIAILLFVGILSPVHAMYSPPSYVYFLFIGLSVLRLDFRLGLFTGIVAALEYSLLIFYYRNEMAFDLTSGFVTSMPMHMVKVLLYFLAGLVAGFVAREVKRRSVSALVSMQETNRVVDMFGQHVSPSVVKKLLEQQDLEPEVRHVCVMFLDIRDFTSFSENREPREVVDYLNQLFDFMIDTVNSHHGIINKFLGDGFMAVFGAPESDGRDSQNATAAAKEILARVEQLSDEGTIPPTRIGIGLHSGAVLTGNVGSSQRREYTVIGDVVNTASRVEQLNKQYKSRILVTEDVFQSLGIPEMNSLAPVQIRGREQPVKIYQIA